MSKELLKLLESMRHHSWKYILTLDDAWFDLSIFLSFYLSIFLSFYLSTDHESIWLSAKDEAPQRERKIASSLKMMLMVVWNPHVFYLIDVLPKSSKFNAGHSITHVLSPLPEILTLY
jgi:hypothetical protein